MTIQHMVSMTARSLVPVLCVGLISPCVAEPTKLRLPGGTRFTLELAQTITSGRTPAGSPVFFRVASDVTVGREPVIRKGTVVEGRMQAVADRAMVGTSGTINFGVRYVPAVDGQNIRVLASVSNKGRSRDGAMLGWVFMWGVFGLTTKGVDAYALRGAELEAEVLSDRDVIATPAAPARALEAPARSVAIAGLRLGKRRIEQLEVSLERASERQTLVFELPDVGQVESAALLTVNGIEPVEPVAATSVGGEQLQFDLWDVVKYCDDGENVLTLRVKQPGGDTIDAVASLRVTLKRK
jgi:hypothetical protein